MAAAARRRISASSRVLLTPSTGGVHSLEIGQTLLAPRAARVLGAEDVLRGGGETAAGVGHLGLEAGDRGVSVRDERVERLGLEEPLGERQAAGRIAKEVASCES